MADDRGTVLLVDDDGDTRGSIARVLEREGYRVLQADGPVRATEIAHRQGRDIDLVVLDVVMPGMSGISVADQLADDLEDLRILYISGYVEGELPERHETPGRTGFLQKPFSVDKLLAALGRLEDGK